MAMSDLQRAIKKISGQADLYEIFSKFYRGDHPLNFASDKFKQKFGKRLQNLRDNLCKTVVNAPSSRLEITGFGSDSTDIAKAAWDIWKKNVMPLNSKKVHREAFKTGDGFVIVWQDDASSQVRIFPQQQSASCALWTDEETGESTFGAKAWKESATEKIRLNLYYPDRIEKYITTQIHSEMVSDEAEFELLEELDNETGKVPLVYFSAGESLLMDVIPLQNGLNKSLADLFVGMEYNSIRQRYTAGISYPVDEETGKALVPFEHDDQFITTANDQAKIGEFADMTLSEVISVTDSMRSSIARVSGIPMHYFQLTTGDFPSGEAQRKAESRFIEIIKDAQISFGESWSKVMSIALQLAGKGDNLIIETQWSDAAPASQTEQLNDGILKKQLGWSNKKIQQDFGLDDDTIEEMAGDVQSQGSALGEALGKAFDQAGTQPAPTAAPASGAKGAAKK